MTEGSPLQHLLGLCSPSLVTESGKQGTWVQKAKRTGGSQGHAAVEKHGETTGQHLGAPRGGMGCES